MDAIVRFFEEMEKQREQLVQRLVQSGAIGRLCELVILVAGNAANAAGAFGVELTLTLDLTMYGHSIADRIVAECVGKTKGRTITIPAGPATITVTSNGNELHVKIQGRVCGEAEVYLGKNDVPTIDARPCQQHRSTTQPNWDSGIPSGGPRVGDELDIEL